MTDQSYVSPGMTSSDTPGLPQERFQFEQWVEGKGLPVRALRDAK
jgi:hypothetical protein